MRKVSEVAKQVPRKAEEKIKTKPVKKDKQLEGIATFGEGDLRPCYVEEVLLTEDPELKEALTKTKHLLSKTISEETINQVFNKKRAKPPAQSAHLDTLCNPIDQDPYAEEGFIVIPIGRINPATRFTQDQIQRLRGIMGYTHTESMDHAAKLGRSLYTQQKETYNCDAKLTIGGETVMGHKAVFAAFSGVLARLYNSKSLPEVESLEENVRGLKVDTKALHKVILWMYTGNVKVGEQSDQIRQIGDMLNMPYLLRACSEKEFHGHHHHGVHVAPPTVDVTELKSAESLPGIECDPKFTARIAAKTLRKIQKKTSVVQMTHKLEESMRGANLPDIKEKLIPQERIRIARRTRKFGAAALYAMTADPEFTKLNPEIVYELLSSSQICVRNEVDVYEAALRWLKTDFDTRKKYMYQLLECPRWAHMSPCDMIRIRAIDPEFFKHKVIAKHIAQAKWYQDLASRGITWKEYKVPKNRIREACGIVTEECHCPAIK